MYHEFSPGLGDQTGQHVNGSTFPFLARSFLKTRLVHWPLGNLPGNALSFRAVFDPSSPDNVGFEYTRVQLQ